MRASSAARPLGTSPPASRRTARVDPPPPPRPRAARSPPPPPTESRASCRLALASAPPRTRAPRAPTRRAVAACRASLCARIAARIPRSAAAEREASSRGAAASSPPPPPPPPPRRASSSRRSHLSSCAASRPTPPARPWCLGQRLRLAGGVAGRITCGGKPSSFKRVRRAVAASLSISASSESVSRLSPRAAPGARGRGGGSRRRAQDERIVWLSRSASRARTGAPRWTCPRS